MAKDSLRRLFITIDIINAEIIIHAKQYNYLAEEIRLDDGMFGA